MYNHGHELRRGECGWEGGAGQRGIKGGKWDSNSIINKIYFKTSYDHISKYKKAFNKVNIHLQLKHSINGYGRKVPQHKKGHI